MPATPEGQQLVQLRCPIPVYRRFQAVCKRNHVSVSEQIRRMMVRVSEMEEQNDAEWTGKSKG